MAKRKVKKVLKYTEWQSPCGDWHCNDVSDLSGQAGLWWVPARLLDKTPAEFVEWLIKTYEPDDIKFTKNNILLYSWSKEHYSKMHNYVLYINRIARQKNFLV